MKIEVESVSDIKKTLSVQVPEAQVTAELDGAYADLKKHAEVPGFRKGKIPRSVLEKKFGPRIEADVYDTLVRNTLSKALEDNELEIVAMPEIMDPKRENGKGFSFKAKVEIKPQFEPKDYLGIALKKPSSEITKDQVEQVYERLRESQAVLKPIEGATKASKGDHVALIIQGSDKDGNLSNPEAETKEQIYEIGGGILHRDVEEAVLKLKISESDVVKIKPELPEEKKDEMPEEFFVKVTLDAIKEKILPEINDEFAKSVGPFDDLKALEKRVREDLQQELDEKNKNDMIGEIFESLRQKNEIPLPDSMVDSETKSLIQNTMNQLAQAGMKDFPEEYSEEKLREKYQEDAGRRVHERLLVEAIAKKESIEVSDKELSEKLAEVATHNKVPVAEIRSHYEKSGGLDSLRFQMKAQKTVDFLLAKANIK